MDMQINDRVTADAARHDDAVMLAYQARTQRGLLFLALVVVVLTGAAVYAHIPFAGLSALLVMFGGAFWVVRRWLQLKAMRFRAP